MAMKGSSRPLRAASPRELIMTHHAHRGGGRGWGGPVIIEEYFDDYPVGADAPVKSLNLHLAPPVSSTPDAALVAAVATPVAAVTAPVATPTPQKQSQLIPAGGALAGGAAGFLVGGPIGAAVGLVAGYLGGKVVDKPKSTTNPTVTSVPVTTPTVSGDSCWDCSAGWAPHGDEGMR